MHLRRASAAITVFCASFGLMIETISVHAQERVSPDKQWEYQYSDGAPRIVKVGTAEEQDLSDALPSAENGLNTTQEAAPVWAPDSKRVAFNFVVPEHRSDGFGTTVLLELRDNKWGYLRSPLDSKSVESRDLSSFPDSRDQLAQLAKKYLPKKSLNHRLLKSPSIGDFFRVIRWIDSDTAVFWAFSSDTKVGALLEMKVDAQGNWKLVKAKVLSGETAEKQQDE